MYLKIHLEGVGEVPVFIKEEFREYFKKTSLTSGDTFYVSKTKAIKWKEEIYFASGIEIKGKETDKVDRGDLAYWPPEKAICLFLGLTQPYGKVIRIGWVLGPLHLPLLAVENEINVEMYEEGREKDETVMLLRKENFLAAKREWEGDTSIAGVWILHEKRVGFEVYVENFGYIIESEPLFKYGHDPYTTILIEKLSSKLLKDFSHARLDVDEEGYVILSAFVEKDLDLPQIIKHLILKYIEIKNLLKNKTIYT